jgi:hypothetical protein
MGPSVYRQPAILVLENTWPARILKNLSCYQKIEIIDKPGAALSYGALSESGPDADAVIVSLTLNPGLYAGTSQ